MRRAQGFSLIELVAVLAIFSVVALIGVQVIQAAVRSSDRLSDVSDQSADLAQTLALMRQDLEAAVPRLFTPPDGGAEPALVARPGSFSLSVGGLTRLTPGATGFGRVTWRHERTTGVLTRQVWTSLTPGGAAPERVVMLSDVQALALDSFRPQTGWSTGFDPDTRDRAALPLGLRVRIGTQRFDPLETMVSLR